jgi:protein TonB
MIFLKKLQITITSLLVFLLTSNIHAQTINSDSLNKIVLDKVEVEASFPGGPQAWTKYISNAIMAKIDKLRKSDYGTCIIRFIVDTKGQVSDVEAITMKKSRLAKIAIEAIANGPKWNPAQQNGRFVNAYRRQPIILTPPDK